MANEFLDFFTQLFYSTEVWGYVGIIVVLSLMFLVAATIKYSGIFFMVITGLMGITYLQKTSPSGSDYIWHALICFFATIFIMLETIQGKDK